MKTLRIILTVTIILISFSGLYAQNNTSGENHSAVNDIDQDEKTSLLVAFDSYIAFWNPGDKLFEGSDPTQLYHQDFYAIDDFGDETLEIHTYKNYKEFWEPFNKKTFQNLNLRFFNIQSRETKEMGFVTFDFEFDNTRLQNGDSIEGGQKGTTIWIKEGDSWKIIHEHLTTK
ncbi:nuclear transport factor 2 family protein [Winogradskyella ursingii]|uniref:nuclear transport factor 2 family protein n=1 Tax=Winogradskyella ursingii TaxID=2686079 RepID=UPI0015C96DBB|nr:nuclear transport factor 2 family protein [Winogradskyella ursingii]